jgi:hypothetical protein
MTMDPKDRKPEMNPGNNWEQDLESVRSALPGLESVEPPDLLDQAVLNTARRELAASRRKPMRWVGAFATAAVVVLALSIVLQQDQKIPEPYRGNGIKLDAARPAPAKKETAIGASAMPVSEAEPPQSPAALNGEISPGLEKRATERKRQKAAFSNAAAEPPVELDHAAEKVIRQVSEDSDYRPADEPVPADSRIQFEDESFELQSAPSPDTAQQAGVLREEQARDDLRRIDPGAPKTAEELSEEILPDPDAWIKKMLELQRAERHEELKHELEAFRKAYPDHPLPPQLQD